MALHFTVTEYEQRRASACERLARSGLDGLLMFRQESMYYLTGYDTGGYVMFQGLYMTADGRLALLTRSADRLQAKITSVIDDVRIWKDREGAEPAVDLREMIRDLGGEGKTIGVEYDAYGLTGTHCRALERALDGFARLTDASQLVTNLRLIKSPAELEYVRRAGRLADSARDVAIHDCRAGVELGAVYGDMQRVIMAGGGDPSASHWPVGCGEEALLVRYHTGLGTVGESDQVTFEISSSYRHYHTPSMFVILTGKPDARHVAMFDACKSALNACEQALKPGNTVGELFDTHARAFSDAGFGHAYLNACGYTMNANYAPNWMDSPMLFSGNPQVLAPGLVFFMHMILLDDRTGLSMSLGETSIVTEQGSEPVTNAPRELICN